MRITSLQIGKHILLPVAAVALTILPACSINVKKADNVEDKKVDIETPMGGIHVSNGADARDTGLSVYPGAKEKQESNNGEEKSANVIQSAKMFGPQVVTIEFLSDDRPVKIVAYYKH